MSGFWRPQLRGETAEESAAGVAKYHGDEWVNKTRGKPGRFQEAAENEWQDRMDQRRPFADKVKSALGLGGR